MGPRHQRASPGTSARRRRNLADRRRGAAMGILACMPLLAGFDGSADPRDPAPHVGRGVAAPTSKPPVDDPTPAPGGPKGDDPAEPAPARPDARDPETIPPMQPPYGQPRPRALRWSPKLAGGAQAERRAAITVLPTYAALQLDFQGRPRGKMFHGAGSAVEIDIKLWRALWLRLGGSYTAHPLRNQYVLDEDDEPVKVANDGVLHVPGGAVGLAYALDLGRILPRIEAGAGVLWMLPPPAARRGQRDARCRAGGQCDTGLSCDPDNICRPSVVPELHAGLGAEWLLHDHFSIGALVRYYALLDEPAVFPVYLLVAARLAARF